jgi:hypothetical protein
MSWYLAWVLRQVIITANKVLSLKLNLVQKRNETQSCSNENETQSCSNENETQSHSNEMEFRECVGCVTL